MILLSRLAAHTARERAPQHPRMVGPHGTIGLPWALGDRRADLMVRILLVPLDGQADPLDAGHAGAHAGDEVDPAALQEGQDKRNEELMKFYRENNVNPAAPCLPLLFQFPVFIALYLVLKHSKHLIDAGDNVRFGSGSFRTSRPRERALVRLRTACDLRRSQLASTYFMSATMDKTQRTMMMILPVAFVPVLVKFPVGPRHLLGDDEPVDSGAGSGHAPARAEEGRRAGRSARRARRRRADAKADGAERQAAEEKPAAPARPKR